MLILFQFLFSFLLILFLFSTYKRVKNNFGWPSAFGLLIIVFLIDVFVWWPDLANELANFFGVGRGVDLFFYISILTLFYLWLRLYIQFYNLQKQITKLWRFKTLFKAIFKKDDKLKAKIKKEIK